jgi:signal transduction histidine kinase
MVNTHLESLYLGCYLLNLEAARIENLSSYHIMDSAPEPEYSDLAKLASQLCQTPLAFINFLDDRRQWTKAAEGMQIQELPVEASICQYTVKNKEFLEIEDLQQDYRFINYPAVLGHKIRFYAGQPIISQEGHAIGTVCVVDSEPKKLTDSQRSQLQSLARQVVQLLNYRRLALQIAQQHHLLNLEKLNIGLAHEISNYITIVDGYIRKAQEYLEPASKGAEFLAKCRIAMARTKDITGKLLGHTRPGTGNLEQVKVEQLVSEVVDLCKLKQHEIKADLQLYFIESAEVWIECRPTQICQVLINLLLNAFEAVKGQPRPWVSLRVAPDGQPGFIRFEITDCGRGIPQQLARQMMEPFFTTKQAEGGSGIGLSICKSIVEKHGGRIYPDTAAKNTRIVFTLPTKQS